MSIAEEIISITDENIVHIPRLGPNGIVPQTWCESEVKIQEASCVWVIHHFQLLRKLLNPAHPAGVFNSPIFESRAPSKSKWRMQIRPHTDRKCTKLYVTLDNTSESKKANGICKVSFFNDNKTELKVYEDNNMRVFGTEEPDRVFITFNIDEVFPSMDKDKLQIYCELKFAEVDPLTDTFFISDHIIRNPFVSELRLVEDIGKLFRSEKGTDFMISVKNKIFKVHKTVLIARSPVFAAMLTHENFKESLKNEVEISDLDEEVVEQMLQYIYTGQLENLEMLAEDLLAAAEKYGIENLKTTCESALADKLSDENAIEMLILADLHNARHLKYRSIHFIVVKYSEVCKSAAWEKNAPLHPKLLMEVCAAMSRQMDCKLESKNLEPN